jgi:Sporulation and spore germination
MRRFLNYFLTPWNLIALMLVLCVLGVRYVQNRPTALEIDPALLNLNDTGKTELPLRLYFAALDGRNYSVESRTAPLSRDDLETRAMVALRVWMAGPLATESLRLVPEDADTPTVFARKDTVYVDIPAGWVTYQLGLSAETLLYCGVASTLLDLQNAKKVQFLLNGKPATTIGGHVETRQPYTKDTCPKA